jgi:demethylmenaquinone methyltransferase/2-methoxy-6-polyprenyl-1,4-benzoquinol methylase
METSPNYDDAYVRRLFDRMGRTYDAVNLISSFGFSSLWRRQCVALAQVGANQRVCDLMAGGGECWRPILRRRASLVSLDFSPVMVERQVARQKKLGATIEVLCENATATSLADQSLDAVVCAFGLKTLSPEATAALAREVHRVLKPGGSFAFLEISTAQGWWLGRVFRWYVSSVIPVIGKLCLGDIECYKMLGRYTEAFVSCERAGDLFREAGLTTHFRSHFHGCATSLSGRKPA